MSSEHAFSSSVIRDYQFSLKHTVNKKWKIYTILFHVIQVYIDIDSVMQSAVIYYGWNFLFFKSIHGLNCNFSVYRRINGKTIEFIVKFLNGWGLVIKGKQRKTILNIYFTLNAIKWLEIDKRKLCSRYFVFFIELKIQRYNLKEFIFCIKFSLLSITRFSLSYYSAIDWIVTFF